ncbi:AAA family ATPase [Polymorphospora sp. NPDC050346]|uniref:AAA family ATPase n=1 Tax=Polymorphospora sp. NPDC050346 TaxID=3155780 RepID=UPI0033E26CCB
MTSPQSGLVVITGGPGAGKTTLISLLHEAGFATAPEAGRAIIQDQTVIGGPALADPTLRAELNLCWDLRSYRWALNQPEPVFFDHALPSLAAHYRLTASPVPPHVEAAIAAFRYRPQVFLAPWWPEIYRNDAERRQTLVEARQTSEAIVEAYRRRGYQLIELPRVDPRERLRFVLECLNLSAPATSATTSGR